MMAYNGNFDRGHLRLHTSNVDMQEKQKENMLDHRETVEGLTIEKSADATGSTAYETDNLENKDDDRVVTDGIT